MRTRERLAGRREVRGVDTVHIIIRERLGRQSHERSHLCQVVDRHLEALGRSLEVRHWPFQEEPAERREALLWRHLAVEIAAVQFLELDSEEFPQLALGVPEEVLLAAVEIVEQA